MSHKISYTCPACGKHIDVRYDDEESSEQAREFLREHITEHIKDVQGIDDLTKLLRDAAESI